MSVYRQGIRVASGYDVTFTRDAFGAGAVDLLAAFRQPGVSRAFVIIDEGVVRAFPDLPDRVERFAARHATQLELAAELVVVPGGETAKTMERALELAGRMAHARLDRHSYVLAIGGGAVLDTVGLAAALVHRGLRLIRMPTTVLAQDDAGIGVKNGVNAHGTKNLFGTFAAPWAVVDDFAFLDGLDDEHWRGGVAEAFKVAMIQDAEFFADLCAYAPLVKSRDAGTMEDIVRRCAILHLDHIARGGDPFETGTARPLDFGHWSAHKLEALSAFRISHGSAVAYGIALDAGYAVESGLLERGDRERLVAALEACGFTLAHPEASKRKPDGGLELLDGLDEFREHLGGRLTVTLPRGVGARVEVHSIDRERMSECVASLARHSVAR